MTSPDDKSGRTKPPLGLFDLALTDEAALDEVEEMPPPSPEQPGQVIAGRYLLKSILGEGGTGQVWYAEQTEPVRREVAVKIIRPGLLTKPVSARFNREHQVLARMEHPNIAAVFDAGELPDGRTYFAMEMVTGTAITRWCRKHEMTVRERLEIFLQACMAVHHAHQKGILHRDLKPSNVMVTAVDQKPVVKVIDFGIAKTLEGDLPVGQEVTLRGMVLGTPRYMSPEQAGLTGQELDARADVYALGVLLYELLTGTTPIPDGGGKEAPLPELLERVRRTETEMPSRRAARNKTLCQQLRGDLDWIALRALQKERSQRYNTAQALAEDVQRHLRDEPVAAGPPSLTYRAKKWVLRKRAMLMTAAAILISLGGGLAATSWALQREEAQRKDVLRLKELALSESDLAKQVRAQLEDLLVNARKHVDAGMNTQMLRNLADECAAGMGRFANQPRTEARLAMQLANLYLALQETSRALPWLERRLQLLRNLEGEDSRAALETLSEFGWRSIGYDPDRAVECLRRASEGFDRLPGGEVQALSARKELSRALSRAGRHEEAMALMAEVIQAKGESDPSVAAAWLRDQAHVLRSGGRLKESKKVLLHALEILPKDDGTAGLRTYILTTLAMFDGTQEDHMQALQAHAERLRSLEETYGPGHPQLIEVLIMHATLACRIPGCPGGEEAARRALAMAQAGGHETRLADAWTALAETLRVTNREAESEQAVRDAIAEVGNTKAERWRVMELHRRLGDLLTGNQNYAEALEQYEIAAAGWFSKEASGRPRDKEQLIFSSFIRFWELAEAAGSPLANSQRLTEWRQKRADWAETNGGLWSRRRQAGGDTPAPKALP